MRCLLLTALAALPGCNLITDFDRDLVVVLEVLGDIREPRLGPVQEARVGRCEEFCELMRDCIRVTLEIKRHRPPSLCRGILVVIAGNSAMERLNN